MAWEKFTGVGRSYKPKLSIRGENQIGFNLAAIEKFNLKEGYAVLYFDKENKKIGVKIAHDKSEEGACKLSVRPDSGASISAKSYITCHGLDKLSTKRFPAYWDEEVQMIVADITEEDK